MTRIVDDPAELVTLFERDRACHVYGLADLAEPYWSRSTWWRDGDAAVGVVHLPDSEDVALYAISPAAPAATLDLLAEVADMLPSGADGGGPLGTAARLRPLREVEAHGRLRKMVITRAALAARRPVAGDLVELDQRDHDELRALHATDPGAVFFAAGMWRDGQHVGVRDDRGTLVAAAGTHVLDRDHRVAAIGAVITHPDHRGGGLGSAVTRALADILLADGLTVSLNVKEENVTARRVYDLLGFRTVHHFEEVRLL